MYHFLAVAINSDSPNDSSPDNPERPRHAGGETGRDTNGVVAGEIAAKARDDTQGATSPDVDGVDGIEDVETLVAAGRYADAAALAHRSGDPARAAALYERIWEFTRAAACAREAGDLDRALRNAIDARDDALIAELAAELDARGPQGQRAAMDIFARKRRFADAAVRAEAIAELSAAIEYYKLAHRELDAARLLRALGQDRDAGRLLERFIELGPPGSERARAQLQLGQLLVERMSYDAAASHLQSAAKAEETRKPARRALIVALAAMGLRDAARDVLVEARAEEPDLPADIETFVRQERAARDTGDGDRVGQPGGGSASPGQSAAQVIGGRYRLDELIGAGGAGRVFRAHDEVSDRACALKLIHVASSRGNQAYERFVREAKVASALRHANLVEVYDVSADQGYMVMELMTGGSLAERIATGRLSGSAVKRMAADVLAGLELAHQRGVIHRDVKPANVFFDARGTAKLGDFGVAHLLDLGQTQTGGLIGTLAYMSPEQITGAPLSIAADLYSLGITLFEALTGRRPFLGPDFVAQHLGEPAPAPSALAPEGAVAPGWDPVLAMLLHKSPRERFASIDEVRQAIAKVDLGDSQGPKILVLHRAGSRSSQSASGAAPDDGDARQSLALPLEPVASDGPHRDDDNSGAGHDDGLAVAGGETASGDEEAPRYQFETPIGKTEHSRLARAVDATLERSVILERYADAGPEKEQRLYALARGGGPFLQRALAYDRESGVAVFEAPSGIPLSEALAAAAISRRQAARLLKRLARAVAPLHRHGTAHGAIDDSTVLIDDDANPTVLICGLSRGPKERPRPADDVRAIIGLIAAALEGAPSSDAMVDELVRTMLPNATASDRAAIAPLSAPGTGEELYALADAIEIALLGAWRRGAE